MSETVRIADLGLIIAAGGSSCRYGGSNKLLESLSGVPVFIHSLRRLALLCPDEAVILVAPAAHLPLFADLTAQYCSSLRFTGVAGGDTRGQSVFNGLAALPASARYVAIHDAARPFASTELLRRCLLAARQCGGALAAHPVTDTLKKAAADGTIAATVDRAGLWAAETPQVFSRPELQAAYEAAFVAGRDFTDDAGVMEFVGGKVALVDNPDPNPKITYPADLRLAETMMGALR